MNLTMRGLCKSETNQMEGYFDTIYFIRDFYNGKPEWRGLGKSHIYYESMEQIWKIESLYDKNRYAYFQPQDSNPYLFYPTGRGNWKVNSGICRLTNNELRRLSLTNCVLGGGKTDFTCRSVGRDILTFSLSGGKILIFPSKSFKPGPALPS